MSADSGQRRHPAIRSYQGQNPQLEAGVFVDHTALVLGDVSIGEDSSIWPMTVIRGDMHQIRIGKRTSIVIVVVKDGEEE